MTSPEKKGINQSSKRVKEALAALTMTSVALLPAACSAENNDAQPHPTVTVTKTVEGPVVIMPESSKANDPEISELAERNYQQGIDSLKRHDTETAEGILDSMEVAHGAIKDRNGDGEESTAWGDLYASINEEKYSQGQAALEHGDIDTADEILDTMAAGAGAMKDRNGDGEESTAWGELFDSKADAQYVLGARAIISGEIDKAADILNDMDASAGGIKDRNGDGVETTAWGDLHDSLDKKQ